MRITLLYIIELYRRRTMRTGVERVYLASDKKNMVADKDF